MQNESIVDRNIMPNNWYWAYIAATTMLALLVTTYSKFFAVFFIWPAIGWIFGRHIQKKTGFERTRPA